MNLRIWHIGDTHGHHELLKIPSNIDLLLFSGDASNYRDPYRNEVEMRNFLRWMTELPIKKKIFVAGNHDTSIESRLISKNDFLASDTIYLENDNIIVEGLKIHGSPITPTFGNWVFMKKREKLYEFWKSIPDDTDILVTHGPPHNIMDLSYNRNNELEFCGDRSLRRHIFERLNLNLCCFGHIHNCEDIINHGIKIISNCKTVFSNGSVVTDNKFGEINSNGNIFEIDLITKKVKIINEY